MRVRLALLQLSAIAGLGCFGEANVATQDAGAYAADVVARAEASTVADTGLGVDASVPFDAPAPIDVPATADVPSVTDVPVATDVPAVTDAAPRDALVDARALDVFVPVDVPADVAPDVPVVDAGPPDPDLYAAPDGTGMLCTSAAPCALTTARDLARLRNAALTRDLHVWLHDGTYALADTFALTAADSGSNGHAVVYEALSGANPVFSGGTTLTGSWSVSDAAHDVHRIGVAAGLRSRSVYVNGWRAVRARGATLPAGFVQTATGYTAPDATMAAWSRPSILEVVGLHAWKSFRCGVASIAGRAITMREPCWTNARSQPGFGLELPQWFENAPELLDEPGEFFLDDAANALFYVPRSADDLAHATVTVPTLETLMTVRGTLDAPAHDIVFRHVTFAYTTWLQPSSADGYPCLQSGVILAGSPGRAMKTPAAVAVAAAHDVTFDGCAFEHLGEAGLSFDGGSHDDLVVGCRFEDLSGTSVSIGDVTHETDHHPTDLRTVNRAITVRDSFITRVGAEFFDAPGVFVGYTDGTVLDHDDIFDVPYTGITAGWGWGSVDPLAGHYTTPSISRNNAITHNVVSHHMRMLEDGGGIYVLGAQPGAVMNGNWLANQGHPYGALYLDNGTQFFTVTNNLVTASQNWLYVQVYAPIALNNIVSGNFSDADTWFRPQPADPSNMVHDNTVFSGAMPAGARSIAGAAGLETAWRAMHPPDVAVGRVASASSVFDAGHTANLAADGNMTTGWSPSGADTSPWWQVDLGSSIDVRAVEVVTRWELDQPVTRQNFAVWLSDDPAFGTHVEIGAYATPPLPNRSIWTAHAATAVGAARYRYVRVVKTRPEYFYLGDVRVLGLP